METPWTRLIASFYPPPLLAHLKALVTVAFINMVSHMGLLSKMCTRGVVPIIRAKLHGLEE